MKRSEYAKVSIGVASLPAVERAQARPDAGGGPEVNPIATGGEALKAPKHGQSESTRRAEPAGAGGSRGRPGPAPVAGAHSARTGVLLELGRQRAPDGGGLKSRRVGAAGSGEGPDAA